MKKVAARETVVLVPVVVEPVEVQVPLVAVPVEVRDVEIAVLIAQKYARYRPYHHPLNIPILKIRMRNPDFTSGLSGLNRILRLLRTNTLHQVSSF